MSAWVSGLAADLLDTAIGSYGDVLVPPQRQGVVFGASPVLDCDSLLVSVLALDARPPPQARCTVVPRLRLQVIIARCVPTLRDDGTAPPIAEESMAALGLDDDLAILWDGLTSAWSSGTLFPSFDGLDCEAVSFGLSTPVGPLGGLAAWTIPISVDVLGLRSGA